VITVTATDAAHNTESDTLTVTCTATAPKVLITAPTTEGSYTTTSNSIIISGTVSDAQGMGSVAWSTDHGSKGVCTGTTSWTASNILLLPGENTITVTATDVDNYKSSATLTVTYTPVPTVAIVQPTTTGAYTTTGATINIAGIAADATQVASVAWSSNQGSSGKCTGTVAWSASSVPLQPGKNVITVTATDKAGATGSAVLTVTRNTIPKVTITKPTTASVYTTTSPTINLTGTASDPAGITSVAWSNSQGPSGSCSGTTSWSASAIQLKAGKNVITVTATNANGNTGSAVLTVTYNAIPTLSVSAAGGIVSTGYAGGPFSASSVTYTLQNLGSTSMRWAASKKQSWVSLSSSSGTLAGGASTTVTVSINTAAKSLTAGSYSDTVSFTNSTNGIGNTTRSVSLTVNPALSVSPTAGIVSSGPEGGPFSTSSTTYTLHNMGSSTLKWTASKTQSWISLSSSGGSLAGGAITTVTASFNSAADKLAEGDHSDTIKFTDSTNPKATTSRSVTLSVVAP
jgi:hypothetical protein